MPGASGTEHAFVAKVAFIYLNIMHAVTSRTADCGLGSRSQMAPEVHRTRVLVGLRAKEHLARGSRRRLADAWIIQGLAGELTGSLKSWQW